MEITDYMIIPELCWKARLLTATVVEYGSVILWAFYTQRCHLTGVPDWLGPTDWIGAYSSTVPYCTAAGAVGCGSGGSALSEDRDYL